MEEAPPASKPKEQEQAKPKEDKNKPNDSNLPDCATSFCKSGNGKLLYADGSKYVGNSLMESQRAKESVIMLMAIDMKVYGRITHHTGKV